MPDKSFQFCGFSKSIFYHNFFLILFCNCAIFHRFTGWLQKKWIKFCGRVIKGFTNTHWSAHKKLFIVLTIRGGILINWFAKKILIDQWKECVINFKNKKIAFYSISLIFDVDLMKFILTFPQFILYFIKCVQKPQIFFAFDTFYHIEKNPPKNKIELWMWIVRRE